MMPNLNDPKFMRDLENLRNKKLYTREEVDALIKATVVTFNAKIADLERRMVAPTALSDWVYPWDTRWVGTKGLPLTSGAFDGDSFSTTAKTQITLATSFGTPPNLKAVLAMIAANDQDSSTADCSLRLSPNAVAGDGPLILKIQGVGNDYVTSQTGVVPCNGDGNIFYQIVATGVSTLDASIQIWGYQP